LRRALRNQIRNQGKLFVEELLEADGFAALSMVELKELRPGSREAGTPPHRNPRDVQRKGGREMDSRKVIVIGAGIGGLSAACWLSERGYQVEILELADRPGGRMVTLERKGDRVDVGAQFYHSNYRYAFDLMDAVDLRRTTRQIREKVRFAPIDGKATTISPGSFHLNDFGLANHLKLFSLVLKHVVFAHRSPMYRIAEDRPEYDEVAASELFKAPSEQRLRNLVTSITLASNMCSPELTSLYHFVQLLRIDLFTSYHALTGGVASLAEEMAKQLPIRYEAPVRQLVMENGRVVGVQMEADGAVERAGHVIVAAAAPSVGKMLSDELKEQRDFYESVSSAPLPMPVFFLDRPISKDVWSYFNDPSLGRPFSFAVDGGVKCPEMVPSGKSIVSAWACYPQTVDLVARSDDDLLKQALEDLELVIPGISNWVEEATLFRHELAGMGHYPPGAYRRVLDFKEKANDLRGVSFVSDIFGGCFMEAAMASAFEAVQRVCAQDGDGATV
jgi:protoporphyrinogen oxidase